MNKPWGSSLVFQHVIMQDLTPNEGDTRGYPPI